MLGQPLLEGTDATLVLLHRAAVASVVSEDVVNLKHRARDTHELRGEVHLALGLPPLDLFELHANILDIAIHGPHVGPQTADFVANALQDLDRHVIRFHRAATRSTPTRGRPVPGPARANVGNHRRFLMARLSLG